MYIILYKWTYFVHSKCKNYYLNPKITGENLLLSSWKFMLKLILFLELFGEEFYRQTFYVSTDKQFYISNYDNYVHPSDNFASDNL